MGVLYTPHSILHYRLHRLQSVCPPSSVSPITDDIAPLSPGEAWSAHLYSLTLSAELSAHCPLFSAQAAIRCIYNHVGETTSCSLTPMEPPPSLTWSSWSEFWRRSTRMARAWSVAPGPTWSRTASPAGPPSGPSSCSASTPVSGSLLSRQLKTLSADSR